MMTTDKSELSGARSDLSDPISPQPLAPTEKIHTIQRGDSLLISDLHLCASRPNITSTFIQFLANTASRASALYILGDLFEYWAGDDDMDTPMHQHIVHALRALADQGVTVYLMHGNRDFLIGQQFCQSAKVHLLQDPSLIHLHGKRMLLSHGDDLCTDDIDYQQFRQQVRQPAWQQQFLSQPLASRKTQIEAIRMRSEQEKSSKSMQIMDVNAAAVAQLLQAFDYPEILIHGHTHRPDQHTLQLQGHTITRWVLGDWYEQGSCLVASSTGFDNLTLNIA